MNLIGMLGLVLKYFEFLSFIILFEIITTNRIPQMLKNYLKICKEIFSKAFETGKGY